VAAGKTTKRRHSTEYHPYINSKNLKAPVNIPSKFIESDPNQNMKPEIISLINVV
jgi:hypothetical protein